MGYIFMRRGCFYRCKIIRKSSVFSVTSLASCFAHTAQGIIRQPADGIPARPVRRALHPGLGFKGSAS